LADAAGRPPASSPHLILVGLPGAGKSTVGAAAASRLDFPFLDLDAEIERRAGRTVGEIFAECGEQGFRAWERTVTSEARGWPSSVLAPGGGWIGNPENVELLRPPGRIVYLAVTPETALHRLGEERSRRPLLRDAPLAVLRRLLAEREPLYLGADTVIDTEAMSQQQVILTVAELASAFLRR
jgi:shikimate kinase